MNRTCPLRPRPSPVCLYSGFHRRREGSSEDRRACLGRRVCRWLCKRRVQTRRAKPVCTACDSSQAKVAPVRRRPGAVSPRTVRRRRNSVRSRGLLLRWVGTQRSLGGSGSRVAPVRPRPAAIWLRIVRTGGDSVPRRELLLHRVGTGRGPAGKASARNPHLAAPLPARAARNRASAPARLLVGIRAAREATAPANHRLR